MHYDLVGEVQNTWVGGRFSASYNFPPAKLNAIYELELSTGRICATALAG